MNPSKLNKRITIQAFQNTKDEEGITKKDWVVLFTIWAAREPLRGREYFQAATVQAENTVRFKIRFRKDIMPSMRLLCDGRIYEINSVLDDVHGDRTETHLMTTELVSNG